MLGSFKYVGLWVTPTDYHPDIHSVHMYHFWKLRSIYSSGFINAPDVFLFLALVDDWSQLDWRDHSGPIDNDIVYFNYGTYSNYSYLAFAAPNVALETVAHRLHKMLNLSAEYEPTSSIVYERGGEESFEGADEWT